MANLIFHKLQIDSNKIHVYGRKAFKSLKFLQHFKIHLEKGYGGVVSFITKTHFVKLPTVGGKLMRDRFEIELRKEIVLLEKVG